MNKTTTVISIVTGLAMSASAQASPKWQHERQQGFWDHARVLKVEPVLRQVQVSTPNRQCWQEEVRQPVTVQRGPGHASSTLVGAIVGGVIGNQFGSGSGKKLATAAGTMLGASLASDAAYARSSYTTYEHVSEQTRCTSNVSYHTETRTEAYDVTYRYRGEIFTTRMPYDPGKQLRVRVDVRPE
ncbi:MAG: glycine zipper 2TM domain-containing protein [Gammaproteobacteria bacterium]